MTSLVQNTTKWLSTAQHSMQGQLTRQLQRVGGLEEVCVMLARVLLGLFFIYFGMGKIASYSDTSVFMTSFGVPSIFLPVVILLEVGGGIALLVGWRIRQIAGLLAGFVLLTNLIFHTDFNEQVQFILFMKNMAIFAGLLLFIASGAGQLSFDARQVSKTARKK